MEIIKYYSRFLNFKHKKLIDNNLYFTVKEFRKYINYELNHQQTYRFINKLIESKDIVLTEKNNATNYYKFLKHGN